MQRAPGALPGVRCEVETRGSSLKSQLRRANRTAATPPARRTPPRPQRWAVAVAALIDLQDEYRAWLDVLPDNLDELTYRKTCR